MQTASNNLAEFLRKSLRQQMNELADHIAGGGCADFPEYKRCCGVIEGLAQDGLNLDTKIGVVLGGCPERKDQVMRVDRSQLTGVDPGADYCSFSLDRLPQGHFQFAQEQRRALQDFHAEQAGFGWVVTRDFQLVPDVALDGVDRVLLCAKGLQGGQPDHQQLA